MSLRAKILTYRLIVLSVLLVGAAIVGTKLVIDAHRVQMAIEEQTAIFEGMPLSIVVVNERGILVRANNEAERMFGYSDGELINKRLEVLIAEPDAHNDAFEKAVAHARKDYELGINEPTEKIIRTGIARRKDGSTFRVVTLVGPVVVSQSIYFVGTIRRDEDAKKLYEAVKSSDPE